MDVIDTELRLRCVEAAASNAGSNPNVIQQARAFYEFVVEGVKPPVVIVEKGTTLIQPKGSKK